MSEFEPPASVWPSCPGPVESYSSALLPSEIQGFKFGVPDVGPMFSSWHHPIIHSSLVQGRIGFLHHNS